MRQPFRTFAMLLVLLASVVSWRSVAGFQQTICFPETGKCIEGRFREYWIQNGGLPVFGYPITDMRPERNRDTGETYITQWFERNRFEAHPENTAPYDVLLGRLGDDRLAQQERNWKTFPGAEPSAPRYFAETGHAISHEPFWQYWSTHGLEFDGQPGVSNAESLALFGLPLSEPTMETNSSGDTVLTQWFERARFEFHPTNPPAFQVLLGLLGNEVRSVICPIRQINSCTVTQEGRDDLEVKLEIPQQRDAQGRPIDVEVVRFATTPITSTNIDDSEFIPLRPIINFEVHEVATQRVLTTFTPPITMTVEYTEDDFADAIQNGGPLSLAFYLMGQNEPERWIPFEYAGNSPSLCSLAALADEQRKNAVTCVNDNTGGTAVSKIVQWGDPIVVWGTKR